jgi:phage shock protein A
MKARSQALDELIDAGTLQDLTGDQTKVEEELSKIKSSEEVDQELKILKQQVPVKKKAKTEEAQEAQQ